jgi:hypothetical protein
MRLVGEILWTYALVRWWMLRRGLPRTLIAIRCDAPAATVADMPISCALRLGHGVQRTLGVLPFDSRCLIRSLVLTRLLARRGLTSTVVLAAKSKPSFEAHAWVEHDGTPLLPAGSGFHRLTEM